MVPRGAESVGFRGARGREDTTDVEVAVFADENV